ncbi:MAG: hypothetical protein U9N80_07115, partial [Chloroflexota bacterium]|nr:hypothetical protein [Chloroflexota bacterium]
FLPSTPQFVTSLCPGYASRPNRAIDGRGLSPHKIRSLVGCSHNGFELSGRGTNVRYLFYTLTSYNSASKSHSIPGPFQRIDCMKALHPPLH